jgi:hypothetical protein
MNRGSSHVRVLDVDSHGPRSRQHHDPAARKHAAPDAGSRPLARSERELYLISRKTICQPAR